MRLTSEILRKGRALDGLRRMQGRVAVTACAPNIDHRAPATRHPVQRLRPIARFAFDGLPAPSAIQLSPARTYASLSGTVFLSLDEASHSIAEPHILAGCRNVHLIFLDWQRWDQGKTSHDPRCHSKLSRVLGALDSSPHVDSVFLSLSDTLALPLESRSTPSHRERTPVTILNSIAIDVEPVDLVTWTLPHYPSVRIGDPAIMRIVQEARKYNEDADAWRQVVARSGPIYQAFDYTASFHSLDLQITGESTSEDMPLVDFGPYGPECYRTKDLDLLSIYFADDMTHNARYFERGNKWHPRLYDELKDQNRGLVSSKLYDHPVKRDGN